MKADATKGDTFYAWPFFLPDGRHYLCSSSGSAAATQSKIAVASIDGGEPKPLVVSDSRPEYANGYIVHIVRGTLVAQRFDPSKLEVSGDPIPLAPGVSGTNPGDFSVSAAGALAYMATQSVGSDQMLWVDRKGVELSQEGPPGNYREMALSPDGTKVAYMATDGLQFDIWVRDLRRGVAMRLTTDPGNDVWPAWSPDGTRIAFSTDRAGPFALMQKSSSGTGTEEMLLADRTINLGAMQWTPDGRYLAYAHIPSGGNSDIKLLPIQGERKPVDVFVEKAMETQPAFSPDGRFVAYRSDESGRNEIYVQPFPPTGAKWTISTQGGAGPQWRGDGKELFYRAPDETTYAVPITLAPTFDAGRPVALFKRRLELSGNVRNRYVASADGQKFLLNALIDDKSEIPFSVVLNWQQLLRQRP